MAQSKSKIKSVEPVLKNGNHSTYNMMDKTFYEFIVEMEDGKKGRAAGTRNEFRFSVGEEVLYEHVPDDKHGDRLKSFVAVEAPPQPTHEPLVPSSGAATAQPTSRYKEDPHKQSLIVAQSSLSSAVEWAASREKEITTKQLFDLAWAFESWVLNYKERRN